MSIRRWHLAIGYGVLVLFIGLALVRVDVLARQVEANAVERSELLERESIMRANNLCVASNELRGEIVAYLEQFDSPTTGVFLQQECPPPPLQLEDEQEERLAEDQEQRDEDE